MKHFSFVMTCLLLAILWVAGGASRPDVLGQVVVRLSAAVLLVIAALSRVEPQARCCWPTTCLLAAAILLALLQLVPLPPTVWHALPGRELFKQAAALSGQPQPWRPLAIVPSAALNAALSLLVPMATLVWISTLNKEEIARLPSILLLAVSTMTLLGIVQFSGAKLGNPLINDTAGGVSGTFANRNHFALFLALGCMIAPVWAILGGRSPGWRGPVALGLVLLFTLTILATGSRAGLALGAIGITIGMTLIRDSFHRTLRWVLHAMIAAIAIFVFISVAADRGISIQRVIASDTAQDMRSRGLPTVLEMIRVYFPTGSGLGGFDPVFRLHEPFDLLKPTYFNHAHNDFLEILLEAGLPGALLLVVALGWWAAASVRAWRAGADACHALPKLGSAMLLLVFLASLVDYPARTPMMMAMVVIAAVWLAEAAPKQQPLPIENQHL